MNLAPKTLHAHQDPDVSEDKYHTLFDSIADAIFITNLEGRFIEVNDTACKMLDYSRDELLLLSHADIVHPQYLSGVTEALKTIFTQQNLVYESVYLGKAGDEIPVELNCKEIVFDKSPAILAVARDVTERKRNEEILLLRKHSLRESQTIAGVGSYVLDIRSGLWKSSDVLDQIFGIDETYIRSIKGWEALIHPDYRMEMSGYLLNKVIGNRINFDKEYLIIRQNDHAERWVHGLGRVELDNKNFALKMIGTIQDITERKKNDDILQMTKQIFDVASEAIFVSDLEGNLLDANSAACRLAKYSKEEMLRLRNVDIVAQDEVERIAPDLKIADTGATVQNRWNLLCSDGSIVPLELIVQRLPNNRYIAIGRDLTERDKVLKQLAKSRDDAEAANLSKTKFLSAAGHDLRQPLAAAYLFIDALKGIGISDEQSAIIDRLDQAMSNFSVLLDTLLNVSKLDAGVIRPEMISVNLTDIFYWLDQSFAQLCVERNLSFRLCLPLSKALTVHTDFGILKSVLMNLVSNAIKYTSRGGILVSARDQGENILFQVWDTGLGISKESMVNIFDDFFQVNNPHRDRTKGLGLGLSIAKRSLELIDGELYCRSNLGRGSVFGFKLEKSKRVGNDIQNFNHYPLFELDAMRQFPQGKRFVVVEDDVLLSEALEKSLMALGGIVDSYHDANVALQQPDIENADCYIVDYMLPGSIEGTEFLIKLRKKKHKPVCAVLMSGDTSSSFIRKADAFFWPVLHKPANILNICACLIAQHKKTH
jgi:PAS domain S-box-containing protein